MLTFCFCALLAAVALRVPLSFCLADWGAPMHTAAKRTAAAAAFVIASGYMVGMFVHTLNHRISGATAPLVFSPIFPELVTVPAAAVAVADPAPVVASDPVLAADSDPAAPFRQFSVKELRIMARQHGAPPKLSASGKRADLLAFMGSLPG